MLEAAALRCDRRLLSQLEGFQPQLILKKTQDSLQPAHQGDFQVHSNIYNHNFVQGWIWPKKP